MISTGFVQAGAKVYITARDAKACKETVEELNKLGPGKCDAIPADMQSLEEIKRLVSSLEEKEQGAPHPIYTPSSRSPSASALHVLVQK